MRKGYADLPLHGGKVPAWLWTRMAKLSRPIVESIVIEYGREEFLKKLSNPAWFQAFGCVLGMDWHSSGITTSVMGALKSGLNPVSHELGIYVCGGRGRSSRKTPAELLSVADKTGLDGHKLVKSSRLSAKIDNTAVQDGYQIYLHNFVVTKDGQWAVIQQGLNANNGYARRYHWFSPVMRSWLNEPHAFIYGLNQGKILNLVHKEAGTARDGILELVKEDPVKMIREISHIRMPAHHEVQTKDVDLRRLGAVLALCKEKGTSDFESVLLTEGLGPRTLQSLTLVSEIIHGTPSRFSDPARFSFAHGGKDGHPFPVPLKTYDETIATITHAVEKARIGEPDKLKAIRNLTRSAQKAERNFVPGNSIDPVIAHEKKISPALNGRTVMNDRKFKGKEQLELFS